MHDTFRGSDGSGARIRGVRRGWHKRPCGRDEQVKAKPLRRA